MSSSMELRPGPYVELPPRRRRFGLHLALFAVTSFTAVVAGSWFWWDHFTPWLIEREMGAPFLTIVKLFRPAVLADGLGYATAVMAILLAHEMGHYFACVRYRIPATLPFFLPSIPPIGTFGAVIRIRGIIPNRRALFDVAAAGPLAGMAVALPILVVGVLTAVPATATPSPGSPLFGDPLLIRFLSLAFHGQTDLLVGPLFGAGWVGVLVTSMNLFPVGQLDGGHAVFAISRKWHRILTWTTLAGLASWVVVSSVLHGQISAYTLWVVVLFVLRDRHPRVADDSIPLDRRRLLVAALLLLIFVLTFIPVPISFVD